MKPTKKAKGKTVKFGGHRQVCGAVCLGGGGGGGGRGKSHIKVTGMWVWLKLKLTPKGDFCVVSVRASE